MLGKTYWVLTDLEHRYVLGEREFYALKKCILQHYITVDHDTIKYCFHVCNGVEPHTDIMGEYHEMYDWECEQMVYFSIDEYLHYLVRHVDNLNSNINEEGKIHSFDDFMKQKIALSQEQRPEIWI